ncbi:hypothetical protein Rsub_12508 [Raphidocelis subcapitata]|uniref:PNPLA domain-containing protein n=1 Tax=Raphidocelis subcapitata TaxID=307507 RepID=A0A2V0PJ96_9CHLO|nr:hypothetical protein Rsub_12508 [Raphidocelis subcapitata]|eukprot:GBF99868.1 hypothetical protein Rsub_12508 [Raphidocelis subcapitata]
MSSNMLATGPLPPLMHNTTSLQAAVSGGTFGMGYSAGGFMVAYFVGVSKVLQQLGIIKVGKTKTAGSSSGGLAQLCDHPYGPSHDKFINGTLTFVDYCRTSNNCVDHLDYAFQNYFLNMVDPDTPFDKNYDKRCSVYTQVLAPRNGSLLSRPQVKGTFMCKTRSLNETLELLRTMVYVPGWSDPFKKYRTFNGVPSYDGAFVQPMPCPSNVTYCVKVLGVSPVGLKLYAKAFTQNPEYWTSTLRTLGGFATGAVHADPRSLANINFGEWFSLFTAVNPSDADIYPNKYSKFPISPIETIASIFTPPRPETVRALYKAGQVDALAWAKEQGWRVPAGFSVA